MGDFQKLKVWQRAKDLAVSIFRIIEKGPFIRDHCLKNQMWRSAVSIPSNIAEGDELGTNRQSIKFFRIAKGSTAELLSQAIIAHEIGYVTQAQFDQVEEECRAISSMLTRLIRARSKD
ncbi:four helix bundle protein [Deltaproteobacteria bacterium]|nr:four helix bundle protein [Deltaproteobacteria bacterium]